MTRSGNEGDNRVTGPLRLKGDTENGESAPLFSSRDRGEGGQEVRWARQNEEMGSGGEIRFIRGGEREQSVISILTLPLEEDRSCCCDKGLVQP